jgi:hypothetical protein
MTGVCEETLGPGIAAYQKLTAAEKLCELAPFDDTIAQLCRTGAGAARNRLAWEVDKKVLCALLCCCAANPTASATGRNAYQGCVSGALNAAQRAMGGDSRLKPEVSFNMRAIPPEPMMERGLFGGLTTTPIPWDRGGIAHMRNRIERDFPGVPPYRGLDTRRPDVVIVNDPSRPPTRDNITNVVEMKFPGDALRREQRASYDHISGRPARVLDVQQCGCGNSDNTEAQTALVTAAKEVRDADVSNATRLLLGAGAVVAGIATVGAAAIPFDGPAGEVGLGALTARLAAGAFGRSGLSAAARQGLARQAATNWARMYRPGLLAN